MRDLFVTGTGTGVGKTVLSALLALVLDRAYWKPIQTGRMRGDARTDREQVMRWTDFDETRAPAESHVFDPPVSPHLAARRAGVEIDIAAIRKPQTTGGKQLVIEGAGGVLVPINAKAFMLDLIDRLDSAAVVAASTSLGTINHTLLTVNAIRDRGLELRGVVMIGEENLDNRSAVEHYGQVPVIGWIPPLSTIDRGSLLNAYATHFEKDHFK